MKSQNWMIIKYLSYNLIASYFSIGLWINIVSLPLYCYFCIKILWIWLHFHFPPFHWWCNILFYTCFILLICAFLRIIDKKRDFLSIILCIFFENSVSYSKACEIAISCSLMVRKAGRSSGFAAQLNLMICKKDKIYYQVYLV